MARFAFLIWCPFVLTACASDRTTSTDPVIGYLPADKLVSDSIIGKREQEVAQIVSPLNLEIVGGESAVIPVWKQMGTGAKIYFYYFDDKYDRNLRVTFVDGRATRVEQLGELSK
jgi:hypothetical protein